ncbi:YciI family protein [Streptomyces sp. SCSIO ZS0520]|uniref:YciI family protein n=1 Tax=Streptomyces sp. SCSIO ZS0520 TaxID=2892996 RepID=UPI0021DA6893|nr:YciI family protein [Streptomyces sp. SCSIO ZS0520]
MKYLVMVRGTQADYEAMAGKGSAASPEWNEEQVQEMFAFMGRLNDELAESGELVDAQGLTEPARARTVGKDENGELVVTDGPYGETKEVLAGYWVLDCASYERVTEIAARVLDCPQPEGAPNPPVHIRPIDSGPDDSAA